ncbi:MAG: bifunctional diaminohydroxyphosphoribosylaminopyrimidine deaminase/5-amino-6-(5-phosphoribosylamino)uracil reductase RibD [Tannerellaceae bacterium]|jgi:diaminohydroxyphosphoribosylaminopyrimidine deaminase/5-amino-6-(5-phosphoribosylamino)uracil reductase|nr:bifunctional diaminohydroxyphosphoribosylaminopyrimidine deaminase/5-amino-6-(5-phosphoribosylamino)uracil reductase RibD [Tannerellaceae bacterium]
MEIEDKYMYRCMELASCGAGKVNPNPMVGAVLVRNGRIIGEGFHRRFGDAHAEVNAVNAVRDAALLREATLYVNLEPCSHHGKTPPCTDLILKMGIPRVVVACIDPFPDVAGKGIEILRANAVEVVTGVLREEAEELNKEFMTFYMRKRPYVYLKWAQSADGFIDRHRESVAQLPARLSSPAMLQRVHKKRAEVAAIMVGTRTAMLDNPSLTVRSWSGDSPTRVVMDRRLIIPQDYHLMDGKVPTLVFTECERKGTANVEYIRVDFGAGVLRRVLSELYERKLMSLLVEGGAALLNSFIDEELYDEWQAETAPIYLNDGVPAPKLMSQM